MQVDRLVLMVTNEICEITPDDKWTKLTFGAGIPRIYGYGMAQCANGAIYLLGGHPGRSGSNHVYRWVDGETGFQATDWKLREPRVYFGCCAMGSRIYVSGGRPAPFGRRALRSCETYDIDTGKWIKCPNLPYDSRIDDHCMTAVGSLVVITAAKDTLMFDTLTLGTKKKWIPLPGPCHARNMRYGRAKHGATALHDRYLIVVGGDEDQTAEMIDLHQPIEKMTWIQLPDMHLPRIFPAICTVN
jgi:hypothetical protein